MKTGYTEEFNAVARVLPLNGGYCVSVGTPDFEETFVDFDKYYREDFSTKQDAESARRLVIRTLETIDDMEQYGIKLSLVRDEVLDAVRKQFAIDGSPDDPDLLNLKPAVERAIKETFSYYEHFE